MRIITGTQLILDGYVSRSSVLEPGFLFDFFDLMIRELNMEYLQRPLAARVPLEPTKLGGEEDEGGWSIVAQITTSHMAIHCWPLRNAFMLDIVSCKPFNLERAASMAAKELDIATATVWEINRIDPNAVEPGVTTASGLCSVRKIARNEGPD